MIATEADLLLPGERRADPPERCGGCGYPSHIFRGPCCRHCAMVADTRALAEARRRCVERLVERYAARMAERGVLVAAWDWRRPGAHQSAEGMLQREVHAWTLAEREAWPECELEAAVLQLPWTPRPVERPCHDPPGSREKLAALEARAARGEDLWHPADEDPREERARTRTVTWTTSRNTPGREPHELPGPANPSVSHDHQPQESSMSTLETLLASIDGVTVEEIDKQIAKINTESREQVARIEVQAETVISRLKRLRKILAGPTRRKPSAGDSAAAPGDSILACGKAAAAYVWLADNGPAIAPEIARGCGFAVQGLAQILRHDGRFEQMTDRRWRVV